MASWVEKPLDEIETTADIKIPADILDQVIGQDAAIKKVKLAIKQRRHLLLVGPPGVGKSMMAQALAKHLEKPKHTINIIHNPVHPNRPLVEVLTSEIHEKIVSPKQVPSFVAEQLGFKCKKCGDLSSKDEKKCAKCGARKSKHAIDKKEIQTTCFDSGEQEVDVTYIRHNNKIKVLDHASQGVDPKMQKLRHNLLSIDRNTFVHATGASETELLGDVGHDPYGSHPEIGTPAYLRVVPGAIHEAHEGVLFIDELPHLGNLQNFILTAMQEKKFPITGRNPQSSGASVKVEAVPCDFLFVGACNIRDILELLSPLRSRILGNGYEILLETFIEDTVDNRNIMARFLAQEIINDKKIAHATRDAIELVIVEAKKRAKTIDDARNSLTLRLRDLGGVIRMAGDFADSDGSDHIEGHHVKESIKESRPIEYQLHDRYGSLWKGMEKDAIINPEYGKSGSSYL